METMEKNWAQQYLIDPLTAPQPAEESGPGTSLLLNGASYPIRPKSPPRRRPSNRLSKTPSVRKSVGTAEPRCPSVSRTSPDARRPSSGSRPPPSYAESVSSTGTGTQHQSRQCTKKTKDAKDSCLSNNAQSRRCLPHAGNHQPTKAYPTPPPSAFPHTPSSSAPSATRRSRKGTYPPSTASSAHHHHSRRRTSSLSEKFPGDMSHRPLDTLRKEKYIADRSRHATRKHHIRPDSIDSLDDAGLGAYHHSGPYDPTLFARNNCVNSPLAAVADTNAETLKATPYEKIIDSVKGHRPLDGVAAYAPGETDPTGHTYRYEQGDNMMIADGAGGGPYKRWPGIQYHPDDIKGKGEPSYTIEKALKDMKLQNKYKDQEGMEMMSNYADDRDRHERHHLLPLAVHRPRRHSEQQGRLRSQSQTEQKSGPTVTTSALDDDTCAAAGSASASASASAHPQRSGSLKTFRQRIGSLKKA